MCAAAGGSPPSPEHEPLPVPAVWPFPPPEYRMQHWWPGIQAIERSTEGSFGILIVDFRDSGPAAQLAGPQRVALRTSSSIRAEFMAARLASCLALVYPQWELLTRESDVFGACEWATLATYCLRFSARSVGYSAEEVRTGGGAAHPGGRCLPPR
ncbi:hypothetical protein H696_05504 [Fonticula alba]|uniref:Uncharacterized protein n=1 Tax=Fonticula alba TaxID=691883 RepID=A0A058Z1P6_FONAL|nr:hypothetical protein H696_05504 [Fonticula alba]KCV68036.1 hypothetical protein H696_05504 [Fonticula alba]|eukprot:XP_009497603.1 hypothetical protein H696_05504 [Fonticula alba]